MKPLERGWDETTYLFGAIQKAEVQSRELWTTFGT